jgi:uncharacterized protein YkwD
MKIIIIYIFTAALFFAGFLYFLFRQHSGSGHQSNEDDNKNSHKIIQNSNQFNEGNNKNSNQWVEAHNKFRNAKNLSSLQWDDTLASQAKDWANTIATTNNLSHGNMRHSNCHPTGKCGQNISSGQKSIDKIVESWVTCECPDFNGKPNPSAGHYSQVMWPTATTVGCGVNGGISVCNYNTGNVIGEGGFSNVPVGNCGDIPGWCKSGVFK